MRGPRGVAPPKGPDRVRSAMGRPVPGSSAWVSMALARLARVPVRRRCGWVREPRLPPQPRAPRPEVAPEVAGPSPRTAGLGGPSSPRRPSEGRLGRSHVPGGPVGRVARPRPPRSPGPPRRRRHRPQRPGPEPGRPWRPASRRRQPPAHGPTAACVWRRGWESGSTGSRLCWRGGSPRHIAAPGRRQPRQPCAGVPARSPAARASDPRRPAPTGTSRHRR